MSIPKLHNKWTFLKTTMEPMMRLSELNIQGNPLQMLVLHCQHTFIPSPSVLVDYSSEHPLSFKFTGVELRTRLQICLQWSSTRHRSRRQRKPRWVPFRLFIHMVMIMDPSIAQVLTVKRKYIIFCWVVQCLWNHGVSLQDYMSGSLQEKNVHRQLSSRIRCTFSTMSIKKGYNHEGHASPAPGKKRTQPIAEDRDLQQATIENNETFQGKRLYLSDNPVSSLQY